MAEREGFEPSKATTPFVIFLIKSISSVIGTKNLRPYFRGERARKWQKPTMIFWVPDRNAGT